MDGKWQGRFDGKGQWEDTVLPSSERAKYSKHEEAYTNISLGFLAFALSSFCVFGNDLVRYLWMLARIETTTLIDIRTRQGLLPLTDAEVGKVRGRCFSASLARIGHAASKATAMRIAGTPCLPSFTLRHGRTPFGRSPAPSMFGGTLDKCLLSHRCLT